MCVPYLKIATIPLYSRHWFVFTIPTPRALSPTGPGWKLAEFGITCQNLQQNITTTTTTSCGPLIHKITASPTQIFLQYGQISQDSTIQIVSEINTEKNISS